MARDWALIEFRPGRYAKIAPGGEFLGIATEAEVRAWFGAGEQARKPPAKRPPYPQPAASPPQTYTEPLPPDEPSALRPGLPTPPEEQERRPIPPAVARSQPPPAAPSAKAGPKPLPPFLERLRGAPEPISVEPPAPPAQEPKPLPPFLLRKLGQGPPAEAHPEAETPAESLPLAAETPPGPAQPDLKRAPQEHQAPRQPAPEEPKPQEPTLDLLGQPSDLEGESFIPFSGLPGQTGRSRPAAASAPPAAEAPFSQDGAGRWLWLDPRQDARHNPLAFDLAAFLQEAIALFQSKEWTGGQKPGRLAIHPDQRVDGLSALAESLGLEIECDPLVNPGTYRLALPKDKAR